MIIDAHQHLGACRVFDAAVSESDVVSCLDEHGVERTLVMPFPGAPDARAVHDRIAALGRRDLRVRGIVNLNPHTPAAEYGAEAERCVVELGFVALKLHTVGHAVEPLSRDGRTVFAEAARLGVPVMVHTGGVGEPFASPSHVLPLAREFPDLRIVLAHAGMGVASREAGIVAAACDNVWLETSWCSILDVAGLLEQCGADRLMLGSDGPANLAVELYRYRRLGLSEEELARVLGGTAAEVFGL